MNSNDLIPRVALAATIVAAAYFYRRQRSNKLKEVAATTQETAPSNDDVGTMLVTRSQGILEHVLDNVADEALKQFKVVLKDGLQRMEKLVDEL
jgi:hypothetical protein